MRRSAGAAPGCAACATAPTCSEESCWWRATNAAAHGWCSPCRTAEAELVPQESAASIIRLVIADDHRLFRDGVASLLERAADTELGGQAATGEDAASLGSGLQPHVVLRALP